MPGDPAEVILFGRGTPADVAALRHQLGLDQPLPVQYWRFLVQAVQLNFGSSVISHQPVSQEIWQRLPYTAELAASAMVIATVWGLLLGTFSALLGRSWGGSALSGVAVLGISFPDFWLGTMLALIFGVKLRLLPVAGPGGLRHLILPAVTIAVAVAAPLARLTRAAVTAELGKDYVRSSHAKGVSHTGVLVKHVSRNALLPVLTVYGLNVAVLLGGTVVVENVFSWPGLGSLAVQAVIDRDFPVIQGVAFFFALILILVNLIVDLLYGFLDPRARKAQQ